MKKHKAPTVSFITGTKPVNGKQALLRTLRRYYALGIREGRSTQHPSRPGIINIAVKLLFSNN